MNSSQNNIVAYDEIRHDNKISLGARHLYVDIWNLSSNDKGYCWAANNYFAKLYNCSVGLIKKWLKELEEQGYIVKKLVYPIGKEGTCKRDIIPLKQIINDIDKADTARTIDNIKTYICSNELDNMFNEFWEAYPKKAK